MTIYTVTLKTTAQHDAKKRADLNSFLKMMKRTFGLKCIGIEEREVKVDKTPTARGAYRSASTMDAAKKSASVENDSAIHVDS